MSGATRTLYLDDEYLDDEFLRRTVGNVRRLNSLPGRLPGAFFFDRRPAAVPAACRLSGWSSHQNALAHAGSTCCSTMTGSVKVNVEPWPGCDSTQILPPCISMMRLDMASPKPVPPFLRVMALSAC